MCAVQLPRNLSRLLQAAASLVRLLISPHMLMAGWLTAEGLRRALGSVSLTTLKNLVRRRVGEVTITVKGSQVRRLA